MKKILLPVLVFVVLLCTIVRSPAPSSGGGSGGGSSAQAPFIVPFTPVYPTNFLATTALTTPTNTVVLMHMNGSTTTYGPYANTSVGRGQALQNAEEDANFANGDVVFCSAGYYTMAGTTNKGIDVSPIDLTGGQLLTGGGSLVGAGQNSTIIDGNNTSVNYGSYSSFRDLTITNVTSATDDGDGSFLFATNQFVFYLRTTIWSTYPNQDYFVVVASKQNWWFQGCVFYGSYDWFANASILPLATSSLVSIGNTYNLNGSNQAAVLETRVQYGVMATNCWINGDNIICQGGVIQNNGVDAGESGIQQANLYVWNTTVNVSGPGQHSVYGGSFTNSKIFLGPGNSFDSASAKINVNPFAFTNSSTGYLVSGEKHIIPFPGFVTISAICTNSEISMLTNYTSHVGLPVSSSFGLLTTLTNFQNACIFCNGGDVVAFTNVSGSAGSALIGSWYQRFKTP